MQSEKLNALAAQSVSVSRNFAVAEAAKAEGFYTVDCYGADGKLKWSDRIDNLVTTVGKNDALDNYLAGSAYTAAWYIGLMSATSYTTGAALGDSASAHPGWTEDTSYSQPNRPTASFAAASAGSKALSTPCVFSMTANTTIKGCILISNNTKGGTTGILYSAGLFTAGDKVIQVGDTLNVSYTASL